MPSDEHLIAKSIHFDEAWYLERYPDVALSGLNPAYHYLRFGARLGRDPGPDFSTEFYLEANPDVARAGVNPLLHFERSGRTEGRRFRPEEQVSAPAEDTPPAAPARPVIDVVVPVYNALEDVRSCLTALACVETGFHTHVIVVNDCSDKPTSAFLRRACVMLAGENVSFELLQHEINQGYTVAVNTGLKASRADYVVTLNSDTIVTSQWLDGMVRCMESAPEIGIVGPLSNAATWQNVPELRDAEGRHAINNLPDGMTPEHMAQLVQGVSQRVYPRSPFVNGFCFMASRAVMDAVGCMDVEAFPQGYGEEDDFSIRAMNAGFSLAYADDVYVFHAKSKSFGSERRQALQKAGGQSLRRKHGAEKIISLVQDVEKTEAMDAVRARVREAIKAGSGDLVVTTDQMRLDPQGIYAPKGYRVDPGLNGPSLALTMEGVPERVPQLSVGVHLHLHYIDLLDEFAEYLRNIPVPFHLYVSIRDKEKIPSVTEAFGKAVPQARGRVAVRAFPNRGRDIGPFLAGFGQAMTRHEYICHIHSKRSPHNPAKKDWRMQLMSNLMGSERIVGEILRLFDHNPHMGMVFPEYHWSLETQISWGTNYAICEELAARLGQEISPVCMSPFPAGSMFWARTASLAPLLDLNLTFDDFPQEAGQVDGTLAHAVERLLGNIVTAAGHDLRQVRSAKPYDLRSYFTAAWPYPPQNPEVLRDRISTYQAERLKTPARVGVLSANAGGYDATVVHEVLDPRADYHLVTDFDVPNCGFLILHDMPEGVTPTNRARAVKTDPFRYIDGYDIGLWADANVMIRGPIDPYLKLVEDNPDVPIFGIPHPHRNCLYEEAQVVLAHKKARPEKVKAQMAGYAEEGYPKKHGLIETGFLIFNLRHPRISEVLAAWRKEISEKTPRDQLSLNYVLWKLGLDWVPLMSEGQNLRTHSGLALLSHGRNAGYVTPTLPAKTLAPRISPKAE